MCACVLVRACVGEGWQQWDIVRSLFIQASMATKELRRLALITLDMINVSHGHIMSDSGLISPLSNYFLLISPQSIYPRSSMRYLPRAGSLSCQWCLIVKQRLPPRHSQSSHITISMDAKPLMPVTKLSFSPLPFHSSLFSFFSHSVPLPSFNKLLFLQMYLSLTVSSSVCNDLSICLSVC